MTHTVKLRRLRELLCDETVHLFSTRMDVVPTLTEGYSLSPGGSLGLGQQCGENNLSPLLKTLQGEGGTIKLPPAFLSRLHARAAPQSRP